MFGKRKEPRHQHNFILEEATLTKYLNGGGIVTAWLKRCDCGDFIQGQINGHWDTMIDDARRNYEARLEREQRALVEEGLRLVEDKS